MAEQDEVEVAGAEVFECLSHGDYGENDETGGSPIRAISGEHPRVNANGEDDFQGHSSLLILAPPTILPGSKTEPTISLETKYCPIFGLSCVIDSTSFWFFFPHLRLACGNRTGFEARISWNGSSAARSSALDGSIRLRCTRKNERGDPGYALR
jgi:hypothetical protein